MQIESEGNHIHLAIIAVEAVMWQEITAMCSTCQRCSRVVPAAKPTALRSKHEPRRLVCFASAHHSAAVIRLKRPRHTYCAAAIVHCEHCFHGRLPNLNHLPHNAHLHLQLWQFYNLDNSLQLRYGASLWRGHVTW